MRVWSGIPTSDLPAQGIVLTIGNFDGVHRGHVAIVRRAREVADRLGAMTVAMTFEPHPLGVLAPERAPEILTTQAEKLALLEAFHVQGCIVLRAEPALLAQRAEDFLATIVAHCRPRAFVEGPDFNFGKGREGTVQTLRDHADRWSYEVHVVSAVHSPELHSHPTVRSSSIRHALRDGRVEDANIMLGRPYRLVGVVGDGDGRGHRLGFPTANLEHVVHMRPQEAVYGAAVELDDGRLHLAAVNVGPQPTFDQERPRIEAYVLDLHEDLRGRRIGVHFLRRLREQARFSSAETLVEQIRRDVSETRGLTEHLAVIQRLPRVPL